MTNWRAECAKYSGLARNLPPPSGPGHEVHSIWIDAEFGDKSDFLKWAPENDTRTRDILLDGAVFRFTANGVRMANSGEIVDLGRVEARCVDRRLSSGGVIRTWKPLGGGKFDMFEMVGLPAKIKEVGA